MYPGENPATTRRQQTGDKAEEERNTVARGILHGKTNSIRVNDLIYVC